jgi:energy-coupling factor transporter ATP-binding protein EcfA2
MTPDAHAPPLTESQLAACAKVACGCEARGGVVLLVGPAGVGKSTVLAAVRAGLPPVGDTRPVADWLAIGTEELPPVLVLDDAHLESEADLARLVAHARRRQPEATVVLAGEGRLLTLVARDTRLEQAVRIRASLLPGTPADTRRLVESIPRFPNGLSEEALAAVHEMAGGVPAAVIRLAELATVVAAAHPAGLVAATDIEAIHRRLSPLAA